MPKSMIFGNHWHYVVYLANIKSALIIKNMKYAIKLVEPVNTNSDPTGTYC